MDQIEAAIHYASEMQIAIGEIHMQMLEHYLYGICSIKGYKLFEKTK
jgi:hypothetical protein